MSTGQITFISFLLSPATQVPELAGNMQKIESGFPFEACKEEP